MTGINEIKSPDFPTPYIEAQHRLKQDIENEMAEIEIMLQYGALTKAEQHHLLDRLEQLYEEKKEKEAKK